MSTNTSCKTQNRPLTRRFEAVLNISAERPGIHCIIIVRFNMGQRSRCSKVMGSEY